MSLDAGQLIGLCKCICKTHLIHKKNTKEIMSVKESVYSDTEFC